MTGRIAWICAIAAGLFSLLTTSTSYAISLLSVSGDDLPDLGALGVLGTGFAVLMSLLAFTALATGIASLIRSRSGNTGAGVAIGLSGLLLATKALSTAWVAILGQLG